jgi:hypothetical protein
MKLEPDMVILILGPDGGLERLMVENGPIPPEKSQRKPSQIDVDEGAQNKASIVLRCAL